MMRTHPRTRIRLGSSLAITAVLVLLFSSVAGVGLGVAGANPTPDSAPTPDTPSQLDGGTIGGDFDSDSDADADAGSGSSDESEENDSESDPPPEGVSAGEYYNEEQLAEWQAQADEELGLDTDLSEMDAVAVHEIFVEANEDGISAGGGGGVGVGEGTEQIGSGGIGPSLDPAENAKKLAMWFEEFATEGMIYLIDEVFNQAFGTPHPENDGWRGILGEPTGETYSALHGYMYEKIMPPLFMLMMIAFLAYVFVGIPWAGLTGQRVMPTLVVMLGIAGFVLLGWNFATMLQMVSHEVTMWFLPSGEEIVDTTAIDTGEPLASDDEEVKLGVVAALVGVKFGGWSAALGLAFIHAIRAFILLHAPLFMGVLLAAMYFGHRVNKVAASVFFWQYIGLLVMNWPTAILLGVARAVNYNFGVGGETGELLNVIVTMVLFIAAIAVPLFIQGAFLGGSLAATFFKGSVLSAGASAGRRWIPSTSGAKQRLKRGGGYINPSSWYDRRNSQASAVDSRRRTLARGYGSGGGIMNPRSRRSRRGDRHVSTDGGYARMRPSRSSRSASRGLGPSKSRHDAGSVDARRRDRYRRLRGED